jgi:hypothetical protein
MILYFQECTPHGSSDIGVGHFTYAYPPIPFVSNQAFFSKWPKVVKNGGKWSRIKQKLDTRYLKLMKKSVEGRQKYQN